MTRLALLATGGTIATRATAKGRAVGATAADLLATVPNGADVTGIDVAGRLSFAATLDDLAELARTVRTACESYDGVVITHGTDTLEETAALLALTHDGVTPVTITGAQRPFDDAEPDGPGNLEVALRWLAASRPGVTVTFADRVLPAIGVRKLHTSAPDTFAAPGHPHVGASDRGGDALVDLADLPNTTLADPPQTLPRVDVIAQYVGADAHAISAAVDAGAQGVVIAAFGAGNATPPVVEKARELIDGGIPVAVATRTMAGAVEGLYAGGGAELARAGAWFAGDLSPWQARMVLAVAIASRPADPVAAAQEWMVRAGVA